ncbi:redoxin domain-containing protein [Ureibacillus sp. FSL K6-8385]|uniref:Redoxin domain-containing protein n=1 Tax=Ureibacillus terrenus TaxID=118246 RepID=A0A540V5H2_9BACL|nr:redoxin domain-containing protein [Ureibacillus terrenus]MED3661791.1 redoxin domain-containing protein [Ureibacillus terrenus]MED3763094.1 redoxin domain-containing protein [Ureibacillus terrenus]TQE91393.1 redoxin domain-containing protein [Ureibacillus terrenus]
MNSRKKKAFGAIIVIVLVAVAAGTFIYQQLQKNQNTLDDDVPGYEVKADSPQSVGLGKPAPDFTLETLDGKTVTLSDLKGKKVVLNFWATWCPPCKDEMPHFQDYYEKYAKEDNAEIVAVNLTFRDRLSNVENFVESFGVTFPVLLMEDEELMETYKVYTIPSTFMINTKGEVEKQILGPLDLDTLRGYVTNLE